MKLCIQKLQKPESTETTTLLTALTIIITSKTYGAGGD